MLLRQRPSHRDDEAVQSAHMFIIVAERQEVDGQEIQLPIHFELARPAPTLVKHDFVLTPTN